MVTTERLSGDTIPMIIRVQGLIAGNPAINKIAVFFDNA